MTRSSCSELDQNTSELLKQHGQDHQSSIPWCSLCFTDDPHKTPGAPKKNCGRRFHDQLPTRLHSWGRSPPFWVRTPKECVSAIQYFNQSFSGRCTISPTGKMCRAKEEWRVESHINAMLAIACLLVQHPLTCRRTRVEIQCEFAEWFVTKSMS